MSPESAPGQEPQQFAPICPHCKREPCVIRGRMIGMGGIPALVFCCEGCRKVLSVCVLPIPPQMMTVPPVDSSLIVVPGREN